MPIQKFLKSQNTMQTTFPKYPYSTGNKIIQHTTSNPNLPRSSGYIPPEERMRLAALENNISITDASKLTIQNTMDQTNEVQESAPPSGETTHLQSASAQQQNVDLMEQNSEVNSPAMQPPSFSDTVKGNASPKPKIQKTIRMKIIPPFRKEHFHNPQLLQEDIGKAMFEIMSAFQPKFRNKITIARTNLVQHGRTLQILIVTAPGEAEEDVARAKLVGIKMMGKTVFPTADEFWRFSPGEFPKRAMIRITNLPALLETDELEELLDLPPETNFNNLLERETIETEAGKVHTGRGRIPNIINSKEHQKELFQWSIWRNSEDGRLVWNEVPLFMSIPKLHRCSMCEAENRTQFMGHDGRWCRIQRRTQEPEKPEEPSCQTPTNNDEQAPEIDLQQIGLIGEAENENLQPTEEVENESQAQNTEDTEDSHASSSSSEDECMETTATVQEGEKDSWQETKKKKRKRSKKSSINGENSMTNKTPSKKKPKPKNSNG